MVEWREVQVTTMAEPAKIKLIKYAKGYGWEISLNADTLTKAAEECTRVDQLYQERYGGSHEEQKA